MSNVNSVFSALADENRRKILVMISKESMHVNAIAENFKISRPAVSKHLRILTESGFLMQKKEGRENYYKFNPKPMRVVFDWLKFYDEFWGDKLNTLKLLVESTNQKLKKRT